MTASLSEDSPPVDGWTTDDLEPWPIKIPISRFTPRHMPPPD